MKCIAVVGAAGGVGTSTLAAHFAAGLMVQHRTSFALDLSPGNTMGLYFGMDFRDPRGLMSQLTARAPWHEAVFRSAGGMDFLPYGIASHPVPVAKAWSIDKLADVHLSNDVVVVADAGRGDTTLQGDCLERADLVVAVASADPASAVALPRLLAQLDGREVMVCLNRFNPVRRLDRDVAVVMRSELGQRLSPRVVHEDESFREALARQQTIFETASSGQGATDCHAQITLMVTRLAGGRAAA